MAVKVTFVSPIGNSGGALLVIVGLASQMSVAEAIPVRLTGIVVAEAVADGLTVCEYAPNSASHAEFEALAKAAASGYADCHGSVRRAVLQVS